MRSRPSLCRRKAAVVEIAAVAGLGEADQRHRPARRGRVADQRHEAVQRAPVACSDLRDRLGRGPARTPFRRDALRLVEGRGIEAGLFASPEAERPGRAASPSMAFQMSAWVSIARCATTTLRVLGRERRLSRNTMLELTIGTAKRLKGCSGADTFRRRMTDTIYKISPESLWREAERRRVRRRAGRPRRRLHPFLDRAQVAETAARHFAGARDLVLVAVDAAELGAALSASPRAAAPCSRISTARSPLSAVRWVKPLPLGPTGTFSRSSRRDRACSTAWRAPLLRVLDAEQAHALTLEALKRAPLPRRRRTTQGSPSRRSACGFPIRSGSRPVSTRMPKWPTRCSGSASASSRSAA